MKRVLVTGGRSNLGEAIRNKFEKEGYEQVSNEDYADVYVINTCTVTHMSDRKSRQYVRRMRKKNH